jgi:sugar lactone lactonase YvrE
MTVQVANVEEFFLIWQGGKAGVFRGRRQSEAISSIGISHPAFGGPRRNRLFVTSTKSLYSRFRYSTRGPDVAIAPAKSR